jgi:hypothetical protein
MHATCLRIFYWIFQINVISHFPRARVFEVFRNTAVVSPKMFVTPSWLQLPTLVRDVNHSSASRFACCRRDRYLFRWMTVSLLVAQRLGYKVICSEMLSRSSKYCFHNPMVDSRRRCNLECNCYSTHMNTVRKQNIMLRNKIVFLRFAMILYMRHTLKKK